MVMDMAYVYIWSVYLIFVIIIAVVCYGLYKTDPEIIEIEEKEEN